VTWIDTSVAGETVRLTIGDVTVPRLALMLLDPTAEAKASPAVPGMLLIAAMLVSDDSQVTIELRS